MSLFKSLKVSSQRLVKTLLSLRELSRFISLKVSMHILKTCQVPIHTYMERDKSLRFPIHSPYSYLYSVKSPSEIYRYE